MRIGLDGTDLLADHLTGVEYAILQLVRTLPMVNGGHEYVLYFNFNRSRYARRFEERVRPCLSPRMRARICRVPGRRSGRGRARLGGENGLGDAGLARMDAEEAERVKAKLRDLGDL